MKKILIVLLFISDLFGSDLTNCTKEEMLLTPSALVNEKDPHPEQVDKMYAEWLQIFDQVNEAANEVNEEDKVDSYSEARTKAFEKWQSLYREEIKYFVEEFMAISREPNDKERTAATKLLSLLSSEGLEKIDEVRIIDSESYIVGLYLPEKRKKYFLSLLGESGKSEKDFVQSFREFVEKAVDEPSLRQTILKMVLNSSENSKVYRNLMVAYLSKAEAIEPICSRYSYGNCNYKIFRGEKSSMMRGSLGIELDLREDSVVFFTYFPSNSVLGQNPTGGLYNFHIDIDSIFFHEIGHYVDFFSRTFQNVGCDRTMSTIAMKFFNLQVKLDEFKSAIGDLKKNIGKNPGVLESLKELFGIDFKTVEDFLKYTEENLSNNLFQIKVLMENSAEVWQMFGAFLLENGDRHILCINRMSDFALSIEKRGSIRANHNGKTNEDLKDALKEKEPTFFHHSLPIEVFGTMMEFLGTSLEAYTVNLQYPYGLTSLFMNEYRLNLHLPYFGRVHWKPFH